MNQLITKPNLPDADAVYAAIIDAHRDLSKVESARFNARLVLLLANHIGDSRVITQALEAARHADG
jgi:hypothetical protein